jgi:hypothetical protein
MITGSAPIVICFVAGVLGPTLIATLRESRGRYDQALYLIAALMLVSAIIPMVVRPPGAPQAEPARVDLTQLILKRLGRVQEALQALDANIERFPQDLYARLGRADRNA